MTSVRLGDPRVSFPWGIPESSRVSIRKWSNDWMITGGSARTSKNLQTLRTSDNLKYQQRKKHNKHSGIQAVKWCLDTTKWRDTAANIDRFTIATSCRDVDATRNRWHDLRDLDTKAENEQHVGHRREQTKKYWFQPNRKWQVYDRYFMVCTLWQVDITMEHHPWKKRQHITELAGPSPGHVWFFREISHKKARNLAPMKMMGLLIHIPLPMDWREHRKPSSFRCEINMGLSGYHFQKIHLNPIHLQMFTSHYHPRSLPWMSHESFMNIPWNPREVSWPVPSRGTLRSQSAAGGSVEAMTEPGGRSLGSEKKMLGGDGTTTCLVYSIFNPSTIYIYTYTYKHKHIHIHIYGYGVVLERAKLVVLERAKLVVLERGNLAIYIYIYIYIHMYIYSTAYVAI